MFSWPVEQTGMAVSFFFYFSSPCIFKKRIETKIEVLKGKGSRHHDKNDQGPHRAEGSRRSCQGQS
jgi:hypothetical protein